MVDKLIESLLPVVEEEYGRAGAKFGLKNNSDHESYAVMKEEFEEAEDEVCRLEGMLNTFWTCVKDNDTPDQKLYFCKRIKNIAILAACECIQVAAMAHKAAVTVCDGPAYKELIGEENPDSESVDRD